MAHGPLGADTESPWFNEFSHMLQPPTFLNWLPPFDGSHLSRRMNPLREAHTNASNGPTRPPTSFIQVAKPYIFEQTIQECLRTTGVSQVREDTVRLSGVLWIDNVRKSLKL